MHIHVSSMNLKWLTLIDFSCIALFLVPSVAKFDISRHVDGLNFVSIFGKLLIRSIDQLVLFVCTKSCELRSPWERSKNFWVQVIAEICRKPWCAAFFDPLNKYLEDLNIFSTNIELWFCVCVFSMAIKTLNSFAIVNNFIDCNEVRFSVWHFVAHKVIVAWAWEFSILYGIFKSKFIYLSDYKKDLVMFISVNDCQLFTVVAVNIRFFRRLSCFHTKLFVKLFLVNFDLPFCPLRNLTEHACSNSCLGACICFTLIDMYCTV